MIRITHKIFTRSDLKNILGGRRLYAHLLSVDKVWFDKQLPAMSKTEVGFKAHSHISRDERLRLEILSIESKANLAIANRPFRRVTRWTLMPNMIYQKHESVKKSLEMYVESQSSWRLRLTDHLCQRVRSISPTHKHGNKESYEELSYEEWLRRVHIVKIWLRRNDDATR